MQIEGVLKPEVSSESQGILWVNIATAMLGLIFEDKLETFSTHRMFWQLGHAQVSEPTYLNRFQQLRRSVPMLHRDQLVQVMLPKAVSYTVQPGQADARDQDFSEWFQAFLSKHEICAVPGKMSKRQNVLTGKAVPSVIT